MNMNYAIALAMLSSTTLPAGGQSPSKYHVIKSISLPGPMKWDYVTVDERSHRAYFAHSDRIDVINISTLKPAGVITGLLGVHGIAITSKDGKGFISVGDEDSVAIVDLQTLRIEEKVKVGKKPDAIIYDPFSERVFVMNGDSNSISVLDGNNGKVLRTILLKAGPEFAVVDGQGSLWVNIEAGGQVVRVDTKSMMVKESRSTSPCKSPSSLALDAKTRRLFLGCRDHQFAVLDATSGRIVKTAPIGDHVDATVFDSATGLVMNSTGDGNIAIFHQESANSYRFIESIKTVAGSKTMGIEQSTHRLFVPANVGGVFTILVMER